MSPATGRIADMDIASLILGIIGTFTGVGALAWQVITWRRSGPIVKVTGDIPPYVGRTGVVAVTAWNGGRGPATVTACGLEDLDGKTFFPGEPLQGSHPLPFRLEQEDKGKWLVGVPAPVDTISLDMRAYVQLASGKRITDKYPGIRYGH